jgi:hypothetical protein
VSEGEDPDGIYLYAMVDLEDIDPVVDVFNDRLVDMQVEEGLPVYVIPTQPIERSLAALEDAMFTPRYQVVRELGFKTQATSNEPVLLSETSA